MHSGHDWLLFSLVVAWIECMHSRFPLAGGCGSSNANGDNGGNGDADEVNASESSHQTIDFNVNWYC